MVPPCASLILPSQNLTAVVGPWSPGTMRPLFLATVLLASAAATFTTCGTSSANLPITELYADPPGIVAADQPVTFRIGFTVPEGGSIPSGLVELTTSWNGIPMPVQRSSLASYFPLPLQPGSH